MLECYLAPDFFVVIWLNINLVLELYYTFLREKDRLRDKASRSANKAGPTLYDIYNVSGHCVLKVQCIWPNKILVKLVQTSQRTESLELSGSLDFCLTDESSLGFSLLEQLKLQHVAHEYLSRHFYWNEGYSSRLEQLIWCLVLSAVDNEAVISSVHFNTTV